MLKFEQSFLYYRPTCVPSDIISTNHPVARGVNNDGVVVAGVADGPGKMYGSEFFCNITICSGLTIGDTLYGSPHLLLKVRAGWLVAYGFRGDVLQIQQGFFLPLPSL